MEAPLCVRDTGLDARRRDQGQGTVGGVGGLEGAAGTSGGEGEGRCSMSGSEMDVESGSELGGDEGFKTSSVSEPLLQVDHNELQETLFFVDAVPVELGSEIQSFPVYDSEHAVWRCPIGAEPKDGAKNGWKPGTCFNCASPSHQLSKCALPRDRCEIEANMALWAELRDEDNSPSGGAGRFFHGPMWIAQRLRWLDEFTPGSVKGPELREALGLVSVTSGDSKINGDEGMTMPWFDGGDAEGSCGGMRFWGYPPGWLSDIDPKELMRARILGEQELSLDISAIPILLLINGEKDTHPETIHLNCVDGIKPHPTRDFPSSNELLSTSSIKQGLRRWASYQTTLFSSDHLPISNVSCPLPPSLQPRPRPRPPLTPAPTFASTFTQDRRNLWAALINGASAGAMSHISTSSSRASSFPWRLPGALDFRQVRPQDVEPLSR
ncbi:hypothetical protein FRB94_000273 [Tulasnella sp. JGI-2019a]|nr:hypothetical protein FRB94_000273 [Tulasnella sp. JGI-2019a]